MKNNGTIESCCIVESVRVPSYDPTRLAVKAALADTAFDAIASQLDRLPPEPKKEPAPPPPPRRGRDRR